jgi:protoporphyrinogen oxidase
MAARRLRLAVPKARITVVEHAPMFGGLLAGRFYESAGLYFDQGTHIFQETGNVEIDGFLQESIGTDNLILYPPGNGDLAGLVFNGQLQTHSHFPDLRGHANGASLIKELRRHIRNLVSVTEIDRTAPLSEVAESRFGSEYVQLIMAPVLEKAYGISLDRLAGFAMLLPGLSRVIIDDEAGWFDQKDDMRYRTVAGFPDQMRLPATYRHKRRSFYSRHNGSRALIEGAVAWLVESGVRMLSGARITAMNPSSMTMSLELQSGEAFNIHADGIVFSTGPIAAARLLGIGLESFAFEPAMPHWIVNMQFREPMKSDICYAHGMDTSCDWYRFTNYRAFSGNLMDRRVTLEVLGDRISDPVQAIKSLADQLKIFGLASETEYDFADVFRLPAGFPLPTTRNFKAMLDLTDSINSTMPANVILAGIGSREGLFFQNEVVTDIYDRVAKLV